MEAGTFEVDHNLLGGYCMHTTMAHNWNMFGFHQSLDGSLVSCAMGRGGRAGECPEMVAAMKGRYTPLVDQIDFWLAQIDCLRAVYSQHHYLILLHCFLGVVASQTAHLLEPDWLPSAEIRSLTSYVNTRR